MKTRILPALLTVLVVSAGSVRSFGQVPQGQILGFEVDSSGAAVPDATVALKNENTGIMPAVKTTASGNYTFPYVDSSRYAVTLQKEGFTTNVTAGIVVQLERFSVVVSQSPTHGKVSRIG